MAGSFTSSSWYRVAALHPTLRGHVDVHVHRYQRKIWYILQDDLTGQSHRLGAAAYQFVSMMDGRRSLQELWVEIVDRLGDAAPTQDEIIRLIATLHGAELLLSEVPPDTRELFDRVEQKERSKLLQLFTNPLSIKIPLWHPDRFLDATYPYLGWIFTGWGFLLWIAIVGRAGVLAAEHWDDLRGAAGDHILAADNLLLLSAGFLVTKLIHELGHAYAVKAFGGGVRELGIMLLVFFPSPYVDASASIGLRQKHRRMLIGAAGMLVELVLAAIALEVWLWVEPGALRALAFNILFVASVSTVLFNANPLLRYDGYYILADLIEMPNLAARANGYWGYLAERYVLRVPNLTCPAANRQERVLFGVYAPASFLYRQVVTIGIALYIAKEYLIVGVILALWSVTAGMLLPIGRLVRHLLTNGRYARDRSATVGRAAAWTAAVVVTLLFVPLPFHTSADGVVWLPESAIVRARTEGFIDRQQAAAGTLVQRGGLIADADDPELTAAVRRLRGRVSELLVQLNIDRTGDRAHLRVTDIQLAQARSDLARETERLEGLTSRAQASGRVVIAQPQELVGSFAKRGQVIAFVAPHRSPLVRAAVDQDHIELVRNHRRAVNVLLASDPGRSYPAQVLREVPAAIDELPSRALSSEAGGSVVTDPRDPSRARLLRPMFQFELQLPPGAPTAALGSRVHVRFEHRWEPLARQVYRYGRQLLLSRLEA